MKVLTWIVVVAVMILGVALVARNVLITNAVRDAVQKATGFDLEIGSVSLGLLSPTIEIKNVKLINPEDFPDANAFQIDRIFVRYELSSLFSPLRHFYRVELDIPHATMVVKDDGESNLQRLAAAGKGQEPPPAGEPGEATPPEPQTAKPPRPMHIDQLVLKLGAVTMRRYEKGRDKPVVKTYEMNIDRTYDKVTSIEQIAVLIAGEILARELPGLIESLGKALNSGNSADLEKTGEGLKNAFQGILKP